MTISKDDLANRFTYHAPHGNQAERYEDLRAHTFVLAQLIVETTPSSREQSLALTKLEEVVMWSNAAIARNEVAVPAPEVADDDDAAELAAESEDEAAEA